MSGGSSKVAAWYSRLEPYVWPGLEARRPDDPRLGELIEGWRGEVAGLRPGRAVLVGFPQDEGVRRNHGRPGAAAAPNEIRRFLYRLTPWDGGSDTDLTKNPPLDAGNLRIQGTLEETQQGLGEVVAGILRAKAVPIVLGGGHETAYGHFLGYVAADKKLAILNLDAHVDVRPYPAKQGHSGSPFRQAIDHATHSLPGSHYICVGAQPGSVSRNHGSYVFQRGGRVLWADQVRGRLPQCLHEEIQRLPPECHVYVTLDADVVHQSEVPGVSAPCAHGLSGAELLAAARRVGNSPRVSSFDLVEINPSLDRDGASSRWAALALWHFLMGLARRGS